jgi:hypothetical protein
MDTSKSTNPSTEPQTESKTFLKINPIEELTKAIGIVHGREAELRVRYILARIEEERQKALNAMPWTGERIQHVLDTEVSYKDWRFIVNERELYTPETHNQYDLRMRAEWMGADAETGKLEKQQSRWWPLSEHMVKTEIIQTALKCVFVAEEHEIRENFKYKGRTAYNSHIDIDVLWEWAELVDVRVDNRPEAAKNQRRE